MSGQVVVSADVVGVAIVALSAAFIEREDDIDVSDKVPADTDRFIVVKLADTLPTRDRVICTSIVRFDVHCPEKEDAHDVGQLARGILVALRGTVVDGTTVYGVVDAEPPDGMKDEPDVLTNEPGFTFHAAISTRGIPQ